MPQQRWPSFPLSRGNSNSLPPPVQVEIGGEALSTEGSEPTHMRYPNETNFYRGYEWMAMHAARDRNPSITLYGLPWTWPGWVGAGSTDQPWNNVSLPVQYTLEWVKGAEAVQGLAPINVLGIWNERTYSSDYVKGAFPRDVRHAHEARARVGAGEVARLHGCHCPRALPSPAHNRHAALRTALDAANLTHVAILCDDGHYYCVNDMLNDPVLAAVRRRGCGASLRPPALGC